MLNEYPSFRFTPSAENIYHFGLIPNGQSDFCYSVCIHSQYRTLRTILLFRMFFNSGNNLALSEIPPIPLFHYFTSLFSGVGNRSGHYWVGFLNPMMQRNNKWTTNVHSTMCTTIIMNCSIEKSIHYSNI